MIRCLKKLIPEKNIPSMVAHVVFVLLAIVGAYFAGYTTPFSAYFDLWIIPVLVGIILYYIYVQTWEHVRRAMSESVLLVTASAVLAILFSCFLVLGAWYSGGTTIESMEIVDIFTGDIIKDDTMHSSLPAPISWLDLLAIAMNVIPIFFLVIYLMHLMDRISEKVNAKAVANVKANARADVSMKDGANASARTGAPDASGLNASNSSDNANANTDTNASTTAPSASATSVIDRRFSHPVKTYLIFAGILFVLWIPVYLAAYPGFFCYDMTYGDVPMWKQYSTWELNDHHPVAQTLVMGFIIDTISNLTGSFNDGVAVYVALQNILLAFIFALMILCIDRTLRSRAFTGCALAYLVFNPLVVLFVECTAKDTFFSAFVVMYCTVFFATIRSGIFRSKDSIAAAGPREAVLCIACILISGVGVCIMRTNGIIAFVLSLVFVVICARGACERKALTGICCGALILSLVWLGPVASLLNVKSSQYSNSMIFSIPSQQISYVLERGGATEEEVQLARDLGYASKTAYMAKLADVSRWQVSDMSFSQVMQLYFALGTAHPEAYFFVFVEQTQGMWNPYALDRIYPDGIYENRETSLFAFDWESPADSDTKFQELKVLLKKISTKDFLQQIPVISLFVTIAFYVWVLLLLAARCLVTRDRSIGAPVALLFFVTISVLFGPCVLARYYLCLVFGMPLIIAFLCCAKAKRGIRARS